MFGWESAAQLGTLKHAGAVGGSWQQSEGALHGKPVAAHPVEGTLQYCDARTCQQQQQQQQSQTDTGSVMVRVVVTCGKP